MNATTGQALPVDRNRRRRSPASMRWNTSLLHRRVVAAFLIVVGCGVSVLGILRLPWRQVSEVVVDGARYVDEQYIVNTSGVRPGAALYSVPVDSVVMRIISLPWVREVAVERCFSGRFVIHVTERDPVGIIWDGGFSLIDAEGVTFPLENHTPPDLPLMTGIPSGTDARESRILRQTAHVLGHVSSLEPLRGTVSEVVVMDSSMTVLLLSPRGTPVWLPKAPDRDDLVTVASFVVHHSDVLLRAQYLDARFSGRIAVGMESSRRRSS